MSRFISALKRRHLDARNDRALARMIEHAGSPAMRDELIIISQRAQIGLNR